jgi:molybdopterin/thiamine biosynthesis adenylyltransferase
MKAVLSFLQEHAQGDLLPWAAQQAAANHYDRTFGEIEGLALANGLLPARYQRNRETISTIDQLQLFGSTVAVIGCGGLGGYIIEQLARLGIGRIIAVDPDIFEEHNLNRQLFALPALLGTPKVEAAAMRVALINPAVNLKPVQRTYDDTNARELLSTVQAVADAVHNIPARLVLARDCNLLGIPLVHGAIAGWYGQVTTQFPGEESIEMLYAKGGHEGGAERILGSPAFTPAVIASLQVAEICKILLGKGACLRRRVAHFDLLEMETEFIPLPQGGSITL